MANFGILAKLGVDSSKMSAGLKTAGSKAAAFGKKLGSVVAAGAKVAAAAIAAMAAKGIKDFVEFEKKMSEVFTLMPDMTKEAERKMSGDMRSLATTMGIDVIDATNALYQAISAGVPKDNAADFLKVASKAAIAGVSDLETSVAALTTILNGYSMETSEATRISDVLFSTVKIGVTNFTELGANIGKVTPLAAELGVQIEEVGGMFAVMTKTLGAGKTAEAGTAIRSMLAELSKEGMKAFENFVEATGTTFPAFIRAGGSVAEALKKLTDHSKQSGKGLMDMFRGVEAGMGALTLAKNGTKDLADAVKDIKDDAGSTQKAFEKMAATTAMKFDQMKAKAKEFGMSMGELLMPLVMDAIDGMAKAFEWLTEKLAAAAKWFRDHPEIWSKIAKVVKVVIAALVAYNAVAIAMAAKTAIVTAALAAKKIALAMTTGAWRALSAAIMANPLGAALAAIAAITTAIILWGNEAEEAAQQAREAAQEWADEWGNRGDKAKKEIESLGDEYLKLTKTLMELNREEDLQNRGLTARATKLELAKEAHELMKQELENAKKQPAILREWLEAYQKRVKVMLAGMTDENQKTMLIAASNATILESKKGIQEAENKILKLTIAERQQVKLVQRLTKEVADEEERRLQTIKEAQDVLAAVAREHRLSMTTMGKIVLKSDRLNEIEKERARILADLQAGKKGEEDSVKKLGELEKERLKTQKEIADLMKGELNELRQQEIDLLEEGKGKLEKELEEHNEIIAAEERKLELIQDQLDAQDKKVQKLKDEANAIEEVFEAGKTDFVTGEGVGVGEFNLSSAKLRREFRRLKAAGQLPEGVKTLRDFQKHVEDQLRAKKDELKKAEQEQKDLQKKRDDADKKKKAAEEKARKLAKQIQDEEKKILKLRDDMNEKEKKTLKEITAERIRLEKALAQFRNMAVGARIPVAPDLKQVMQGLGVKIGDVAVAVSKVADKPPEGTYEWDGKLYDSMTGELMKKTEGELADSNEKLGDIRNRLEGFFVNQ